MRVPATITCIADHMDLCLLVDCLGQQEVQQDELCLTNMKVLGPASPAAGAAGMQLFKPPPVAADGAGPAAASARTQRGGAAVPAVTLPIVRAVDVFLAAHIEGLSLQVCTNNRIFSLQVVAHQPGPAGSAVWDVKGIESVSGCGAQAVVTGQAAHMSASCGIVQSKCIRNMHVLVR